MAAFSFPPHHQALLISQLICRYPDESRQKVQEDVFKAFQYFLSRRQKVDKTISLAFSLSALNTALDGCRKETITETIE